MLELTQSMLAAEVLTGAGIGFLGVAIGSGLCAIGAGLGVGLIGGKAAEATARQPEAGGRIFLIMILTAAMVEGVAFWGSILCLMVMNSLK
jgi:F-type H+-transporting ATPase subunit c